jgi:CDP-paratose 2-epimerase
MTPQPPLPGELEPPHQTKQERQGRKRKVRRVPKWIVTGAAGFIGSNTVRTLAEVGIETVALDNLSRPTAPVNATWLEQELGSSFRLHEADVRDFETIDALFARNADADVVLHLAGQVAVTTSVVDPVEDFAINALGSFNVLEVARRRIPDALFVNASTNKVYGQLETHRIEELDTRYADADYPAGVAETHPLDPHSPYGCSKAAADVYTLDYARIYGQRAVSFRQSCIYGPRQFGVEDQGWVAWFAIATELGRPVTVFGTGKQVRDLLHVDDLVTLYLRAAEAPDAVAGKAFNIGGGPENTLSLLELLMELGTNDVAFADERPGDQKVFVADVRRARTELSWEPRIPLEQGLEQLLAWVRENAGAAAAVLA